MLLLDVFLFAAAQPDNVKCLAVKAQIAARQSKKPAVRTQTRLFLFFWPVSPHAVSVGSFPACLTLTDISKYWTKQCLTFTSRPIWGFLFSCWCQRLREIADEIKLCFPSWSLGCPLVALTLRPGLCSLNDIIIFQNVVWFFAWICFQGILHIYPVTFQQPQTQTLISGWYKCEWCWGLGASTAFPVFEVVHSKSPPAKQIFPLPQTQSWFA